MNTQNASLTLDEKTYTSLIYTLLALLILVFFFSASLFVPTAHDIALQYGQETKTSWMSAHVQNGRYIPATILFLIDAYGYDYFNTIGFWILGFAAALWFCTLEFIRYLKLPVFLTPLLTLMIGFHGFWAELIPSLSVYLEYTTGLIASGLALLCARHSRDWHVLSISFLTLCLWMALASCPPMAFIPLFAALLAPLRDGFFESDEKNRRGLKTILPLFIGFAAACFVFFVTCHFLYPLSMNSIHWTLSGTPPVFLLGSLSYPLLLPLHEQILYGLAHIGVVTLALCIRPWRSQSLALGTLMIGFLMSSGPLEWPEPLHRSMLTHRIPVVSFHVGLVMIFGLALQSMIKPHSSPSPLRQRGAGLLLALVLLSGGNQLSHLMERWWNYEDEYAIASGIVADLREKDLLKEGKKIAFIRKNPIVTHNRISTFLAHDENAVPFLNRVSGFTFTPVLPNNFTSTDDETVCDSRHIPWDIHYKKDVIFICLSSPDRKERAS